jgi:hypothetical protein
MAYPEKIPSNVNNINSFKFSFSHATKEKNKLTESFESINERIEQIANAEKFYIGGIPIIRSLLGLNPTKNDFKKLSKALDRLADLIEIQQNLNTKITVHDAITENPNWFIETFGDFSSEIDNDIEQLFNDISE